MRLFLDDCSVKQPKGVRGYNASEAMTTVLRVGESQFVITAVLRTYERKRSRRSFEGTIRHPSIIRPSGNSSSSSDNSSGSAPTSLSALGAL